MAQCGARFAHPTERYCDSARWARGASTTSVVAGPALRAALPTLRSAAERAVRMKQVPSPLAGKSQAKPLERLADPRGGVLARLEAALLHQAVGVLVPAAVRKIVAEHGG